MSPESPWQIRDVARRAAPPPELFVPTVVRPGVPVVLTGLLDPAVREAISFEQLRSRYAHLPVPAFPTRDGSIQIDERRGLAGEPSPLGDVLSHLGTCGAGRVMMSSPHDLPETLTRHLTPPRPVARAPWNITKLWAFPIGTKSSLHWDLAQNIHTVLEGRKRFWLLPPSARDSVAPASLWSSIPNGCHVDPQRPDFARYPRFEKVEPWVAEVGPGETLFLPGGWWHHVTTVEPTLSVNTFFAFGGRALVAAASDLFKRIRGISR